MSVGEGFYIISYDIQDDKRRNKIAKCLENYGTRVQYSVFECILSIERLRCLKEEIVKIVNLEEDSVRVYNICAGCLEKVNIIGCGEVTKDLDVYCV